MVFQNFFIKIILDKYKNNFFHNTFLFGKPRFSLSIMKTFQDNQLSQARTRTDAPADNATNALFATLTPAQTHEWLQWLTTDNREIPTFAQPAVMQSISTFFIENSILPSWADLAKMEKASLFFQKNKENILFTLGTYSLPYCYAAKNGVKVLFLSKRLQTDARKRLEETANFLINVTSKSIFVENSSENSLENLVQNSLENISKGAFLCIKVRLLHAAIRNFVLNKTAWNASEWGEPVNQEDMAGTNLSFSYIILQGLKKMNIPFVNEEAENYLHLWNVIGYFLGVETQFLPDTMKESFWLDKLIAERQFAPSDEGKILTKALLGVFKDSVSSFYNNTAIAQMRFLLGDKISDMVDVPKSTLFSGVLAGLRAKNLITK